MNYNWITERENRRQRIIYHELIVNLLKDENNINSHFLNIAF